MRHVRIAPWCVLIALAVPGLCLAQAKSKVGGADDIVEVEAKGEGISKDSALKDALRKALEQGGKTEIFSQSNVENFQLMKDTIISRAQGIVKDYKIIKQGEGVGGVYFCHIKAKVSKSALATAWGEVQNVLKQIGRPKILVWINEKIDGQLEQGSILESKIEGRLLKSGFDLVARTAMQDIRQKEAADAAAENNIAKMQAIAKGFNAHIFVYGHANANQAGVNILYGVPIAYYNCDAMAKIYYTDSGKLLASESLPNTRGGARGHKEYSPQAGKVALDFAGKALVEKLYVAVMNQWATQISAGGELILEVQGLKAIEAIKLKKLIAKMKGVENVNSDFSKGIVKYRINAKMGGEELVERLSDGEFAKLIEVVDYKLNRVQAEKAPG